MKITPNTDTQHLAELMGNLTLPSEARAMLALLIEKGISDTDQVSDREWSELIAQAVANVPHSGRSLPFS